MRALAGRAGAVAQFLRSVALASDSPAVRRAGSRHWLPFRVTSLFLTRGVILGLALGSAPRAANAVDWNLRLDPALAGPLSEPQLGLFAPGGGGGHLRVALTPVGFLDLHVTLGVLALGASRQNPDDSPGTAWQAGGGLRFKMPWTKTRVSPWLDGEATYTRTGPLDRASFSVGAGVSFAVDARRIFRIGPYLRYLQIISPSSAGVDDRDAKILAGGLSLEVGGPVREQPGLASDRDGDGVPDREDRCPDVPEDRDGYEDQDGCPELDNDQDGIGDDIDQCPNQPEDKDGFQDVDGCPEPDNDGDGITDASDRCPNVAEDRDGFEDQDGCPEADNDKDGVLDGEDGCPNLPGTKESGGCPDRDGDQVDDQHDDCPDVPGPADNKGCPVHKNVKVTESKLVIEQKIFFAHDSTKILPKSFPLLDEVAKVLQEHAKLRVRVEGHTDSSGKADYNRRLSEGRAQAVRDYLVARGIAVGRLDAKGYGPDLPIDTNATVAGREHNRRVEFVITGEEGK
jgi:outer membrane protein OmpA-like peptidoglycan-associated protein